MVSRHGLVSLVTVFVLVVAGAWSLHAQATRQPAGAQLQPATSIDATILSSFRWRSIGPRRGGRSIAISGVRGRPKEGYLGATGGGLWKTTDGGESWTPVTDGQIHSSSVGAVAVSETVPDIVFTGMGESCIRGDVMEGDGVYKSIDAGKTWTHLAFPNARVISKIRVHPFNPDVVFVAAFGRLSIPSDERGVYKSVDGGKTWRRTLFKDDRTGAVDIAIDSRCLQLSAAMEDRPNDMRLPELRQRCSESSGSVPSQAVFSPKRTRDLQQATRSSSGMDCGRHATEATGRS